MIIKKGYFKQKYQASEKYVYLYEHGRFYERIKRSFIRFMYSPIVSRFG